MISVRSSIPFLFLYFSTLLGADFSASAFVTTVMVNQQHQSSSSSTTASAKSTSPSTIVLPMAVDGEDATATDASAEKVGVLDEPPLDAGSHAELMYALGVNLARQLGDVRPLVENGEELAQVAKGLLDTVIGRFSDEGQRTLLATRGKELNALIAARAQAISDKLAQAGRDMLENMKQEPGVVTLEPSGVVLHVLESKPDAPRPTRASAVKIHYHGTLADGTIFDSTLSADPVTMPLANAIPGWTEGVLKMKEGETAMLGVPPDQAYGDKGTPDGRIPPNSTLFFKIQLLEILSASIGGAPSILGADGKKISTKDEDAGSGLLGADGKPL